MVLKTKNAADQIKKKCGITTVKFLKIDLLQKQKD